MTRLELIANRSVQPELEGALEAAIPALRYTEIPVAHGKGKKDRKLGTATWPEENFLLIAYLPDEAVDAALEAVAGVKRAYPREGIHAFVLGGAR